MRKKVMRALDQWGYYLLALLCAAAILLSAVWTNAARGNTPPDLRAAADQNERLSDVKYREDAALSAETARPCEGEILRPFSAEAVFVGALATWRTHEAIDYACAETEDIRALRAGRVTRAREGEIFIDHGGGCLSAYRGAVEIVAEAGASVAAGDVVARGGTPLHGGECGVCVAVLIDGQPIDFSDWFRINMD